MIDILLFLNNVTDVTRLDSNHFRNLHVMCIYNMSFDHLHVEYIVLSVWIVSCDGRWWVSLELFVNQCLARGTFKVSFL